MEKTKFYPPVVTVLGHVDHGKTTLLDAIRKTTVALKEVGSITQSIGSYKVEVSLEGEKRAITFIDTPGHEAFLAMRSRGVSASDIALLVVASNEGVKPQTRESIQHIKAAHIPCIVVVTKSDLPNIDEGKVKGELVKAGIALEGLGGNVPLVSVSAKTGKGIPQLLEMILLVWEMLEKQNEGEHCKAVVIESKLDPRRGIVATLVVKGGVLTVGDEIYAASAKGKVRAIVNDRGQNQRAASIGDAVEVLGFSSMPPLGDVVTSEKTEISPQVEIKERAKEEGVLTIVLRAGSEGALETVLSLLPKEVALVSRKSGEVSASDVLLAKANNALIIVFQSKVPKSVFKLSEEEGVIIKQYQLIYELIDEISEAVDAIKTGIAKETVLGKAQVLASFPFEKTRVLGVKVLAGRLTRGDKVRLERDGKEVGKSVIKSMKRQKESISIAKEGTECGILLESSLDFEIGDMVLSYKI